MAASAASPVGKALPAMIGPHAVIHSVAVMRECLGDAETADILANAQIAEMPTGEEMSPEVEALRLHRWLALREPLDCFDIAEESARRTAEYIIANRIPAFAAWLLRSLPDSISGALRMRAIRRHAWTFVGAGQFTPMGAWKFQIDRSHADDPVLLPASLFHWYAKVFEHLYIRLVSPECRCEPEEVLRATPNLHRYRIARGSHAVA